ncbi:ECF RNA polymerase sigma factor SigK [Kitasatospora sp. NPDC101801]|uniref:ECF RNA polymerase sigma factor SigK n=1 Tax=Kitasatospora sp. NPDC101801 TaxID=3364103 RepID=UPI003819F1B8
MTSPWHRRCSEDQTGEGRPEAGAPGQGLRALLHRVALGDEAAFGKLYDVIAGPVFGVVRRVVLDRAQAEEVTQEVLLEIWRGAARYRPERGQVLPWVLTIAHRRAVDRVRAAQAAADRDRREAAAAYTCPYDEVAERVEVRADQELVRRCLRELTEVQRQSIALAYYGGYSQAQVAELLGTPLGTVKTRTRDGLIRMRDALTAEARRAPGRPAALRRRTV